MYHQAASYILSYTFTTSVTYYSSQQLLFNIWFFRTLKTDLFIFGNHFSVQTVIYRKQISRMTNISMQIKT